MNKKYFNPITLAGAGVNAMVDGVRAVDHKIDNVREERKALRRIKSAMRDQMVVGGKALLEQDAIREAKEAEAQAAAQYTFNEEQTLEYWLGLEPEPSI